MGKVLFTDKFKSEYYDYIYSFFVFLQATQILNLKLIFSQKYIMLK